ncbi:CheY chemotaxis protein or a CheY-like REC (receiver) domain [Tranquillimonas rosea]|uniref:CheY chemotaxis protein or a CheY-like REC (Receiver) domain n=1 Tax=Tranquillimonas rosea TaxID=641238 RepID=A0A1H9U9E9_9RHOB|nr:response regulator [Tranquillimonas rosea]SES05777.1 CheY chemotaxis protein or a CheY-like REC (receiver) domain [Tranquillimonas rosea]
MNTTTGAGGFSESIAGELPYLRRYARALTGSQETGDRYAAATLEAILQDRSIFSEELSPKTALFHAFHMIWSTAGAPTATSESESAGLEQKALDHMAGLTSNSREALLLNTIEGFTFAEVAQIMEIEEGEAENLVHIAISEMERSMTGKVMIIEDEAIIAMDIHSIVDEMGHTITGIARTRAAAVELGAKDRPDLILADIQLADNSSGIDAVNDLLQQFGDIPVIFITAFPERLLTGDRPEPAFLISKPYSEEQVRSAVSQAMFFASTETLVA